MLGVDNMNCLLWEYEEIYHSFNGILEDALDTIKRGCTLKEFLDLGFNNATLLNPFEEDTDKNDIWDLYIDRDGNYSIDLTEDMLNTRVSLSSTYIDGDGFTCCMIVCENDDDFHKFDVLLEEEI